MKLHHLRAGAHVIAPVGRPDFEVEGDADFEIADPVLAKSLLEQVDNYGPADEASAALLAEIQTEADTGAAQRQAAAAAELAAAEDRLATARAELAALQAPETAVVAAPEAAVATAPARRRRPTPTTNEEV